MPSTKPRVGLRIERNLLDKFHHVARYNERSVNREIELLVRNHINSYEETHGEIILDVKSEQLTD